MNSNSEANNGCLNIKKFIHEKFRELKWVHIKMCFTTLNKLISRIKLECLLGLKEKPDLIYKIM